MKYSFVYLFACVLMFLCISCSSGVDIHYTDRGELGDVVNVEDGSNTDTGEDVIGKDSTTDTDIDVVEDTGYKCVDSDCDGMCKAQGLPYGRCKGIVCFCGNTDSCTPNSSIDCYSGNPETVGKGICHMGKAECEVKGVEQYGWGECKGEQLPQKDICNNLDDNCDGNTDETCCTCVDSDGDGYYPLDCQDNRCPNRTDCNDKNKSVHPGATEVCNSIDDNCDGNTDEGLSCIPHGKPCKEGDVCAEGDKCVLYPSGRQVCDNPKDCTPTGNECEIDQTCVASPMGGYYCIDNPHPEAGGCGWQWTYSMEPNPIPDDCNRPVARHLDASTTKGCFESSVKCSRTQNGYDCAQEYSDLGWVAEGKCPNGKVVFQNYFSLMSYGIKNAESADYCMLLWGVHKAKIDSENRTLVFDAGQSISFEHKNIKITTDLYNQNGIVDPVEADPNKQTLVIFWDVSAKSLENQKIPYDYYGLDSSGGCTDSPSLKGGEATYKELVEHVILVENPQGETGNYNVAMAYYLPYYLNQGFDDMVVATGLYCYGIDGKVYKWEQIRPIKKEYIFNSDDELCK